MSTSNAAAPPRRLDRAEAFFWFLDRSSSMNFTVYAEGRGGLNESALQSALDASQLRHPLLNVAIQLDAEARLSFVPVPASGIPLTRIASASWQDALAEQMVLPFALDSAPLLRAYRIDCGDGDWVVALVFHHAVADARSGFALLGEILEQTANGVEPRSALPARASLLQLYPDQYAGEAGLEASRRLRQSREAAAATAKLAEPQAGFGPDPGRIEARWLKLSLPPAALAALRARARQAGTTLSGLVGAAQLLALHRLFRDPQTRVLGLTFPADLRPHLSTPLDAATPGLYITLITSMQAVSATDEIWGLARRLSTALQQQLASGEAQLFYNFIPRVETVPATDAEVQRFTERMARAPQTSLLSNAGALPPLPELAGLQIQNRGFALCPSRTQSLFSAVSSDSAGMRINLNYNRAQFPEAAARAVADCMQALLEQAA